MPAPGRDPEEPDELDEELTLPPLDDDGQDDAEDAEDDESLAPLDEEGLDDSTVADLDVGGDPLDIDETEAGEGLTDGAEIDVGPLDEGILVDEGDAFEGEPEGGADHEGIAIDEEDGDDDGGAEGTSEDPGDGIDEAALPDIDDDGEGEVGDEELAEVPVADPGPLPWAVARWALLEGAGAEVPCRAVAAGAGRAAAGGEVLLLVEEGARAARRLPFGEGAAAVALTEDALLVATARGQLLVARDAGREVSSLGSWRAGPGPKPVEVELAATPGRFWIRAGAALLCSTAPDQPLAQVRERGVSAITAGGGVLLALTRGESGPAIERFRGDDEGWAASELDGAAREIAEGEGALLAAAPGGRALAVGDRRRVAVSRDGGARFTVVELEMLSAIAFAGDGGDAPLLAISTAEGTARLVEISAAGAASGVAEIVGLTGAAALAWDAAREVAWVACNLGLLALGRPRRH